MTPNTVDGAAAPEGAGRGNKTRRRRIRRLLILASLLLLVLPGFLGWALATSSGFAAVYELAQRLAPGVLQIRSFEGSLSGPLVLYGVQLRSAATDVDMDELHWDWYPSALLTGTVHIGELSVAGVRVLLNEGQSKAADAGVQTSPGLALPQGNPLVLRVVADSVRVERASIESPQLEAPLEIERLAVQAELTEEGFTVAACSLEAPGGRLDATAKLGLTGAYPLTADFEWMYEPAAQRKLQGRGSLRGDSHTLELQHVLDGVAKAHLSGTVREVLDNPRWQLVLDIQALDVGQLDPELPPLSVTGQVSSSGRVDDMEAQAALTLDSPDYGQMEIPELRATFDGSTLKLHTLRAAVPERQSEIVAEGSWAPGPAFGEASVQAEWRNLVWPLAGEPSVSSPKGTLRASGNLEAYELQMEGGIRAPDAPPAQLFATGLGDAQKLEIQEARVQVLGGVVTAAGTVGWAPAPSWQFRIAARDLDPGSQWESLPGRLTALAETGGRYVGERLEASFALTSLEGRLQEHPVSGTGLLKVIGDSFELSHLELSSGASRVSAAGSVNDRWKLRWEAKSDDLGTLLTGARGTFSARGTLAGPRGYPDIRAEVQASGIAVEGQGVARLTGDIRLPLSGREPFSVSVAAEELDLAGTHWRSMTIRGVGEREAHQLYAAAGTDSTAITLSIEAGLGKANRWRGQVASLELTDKQWGSWRTLRSTRFDVSARGQTLETLCLVEAGTRSKLCVEASRGPGGALKAELEVAELGLALLEGGLPAGIIGLDGLASGRISVVSQKDGALFGEGRLRVPRGVARFELADTVQEVDFSESFLDAAVNAGGVRAALAIPLKEYGGITGELNMPGWSTLQPGRPDQALRGRLKGEVDNLSFLVALVPELSEPRGQVDLDLVLSGVMDAPRIQGTAQLLNAGVEIPVVGVAISELSLVGRSAGLETVEFEGQAVSGGGRLTLSGRTRLVPSEGFPTVLSLRGKEFVVVDIPEAWMPISPDLTLKSEGNTLLLSGELYVPRARLRPRSQPEGTVSTSADVVVVSGQAPKPRPEPKLHADVRLRLGDQVSFEGFGLRARFEGNLVISQEPRRPAKGNGQVNIRDGTYKAYGQDLTIENGRVIFADSPVENPGLDIRAVRKVDNVTAGVRVTGTLKNPKLAIFSDPAMSQSEALSYLVLGRPLQRGAGTDKASAQALVDQAAVAGGGLLAKEVGRQLGLDDVRLERSKSGEDLSLLVGTYLSPKLYAQYVTSLQTKSNRLRLRYDLTPRVEIQTETGDAHGLDVFYKIER